MNFLPEVSKYPDRSFDLCIMHGVKRTGPSLITASVFQNGGAVCTGIQKLIQRFYIELLTPANSMRFFEGRGCDFLKDVFNAHSDEEVKTAFLFALMDVKLQLQSEEEDDWPDDERFLNAELIDTAFFGSTLSAAVRVISRSKESAEIILPIYL